MPAARALRSPRPNRSINAAAAALALAALCPALAATARAATYAGSFSADGGNYLAEWGVVGDRIDFRLTAATQGWVAIGFSDNQQMSLTDIIMANVDPILDEAHIRDAWATGRSAPPPDASGDVTATAWSLGDNQTTVEFSRFLDTGDAARDLDLNTPRYLLWAYNSFSADFSSYHSDTRGFSAAPVDFSAAIVPEPAVATVLLASLAAFALRRRRRPRK